MINNIHKALLKNEPKTLVIKRAFSSFSTSSYLTKISVIKEIKYEKIIKRNMRTMLNIAGTQCTKVSHSVLPKIQNAPMSSVKNIRFKKILRQQKIFQQIILVIIFIELQKNAINPFVNNKNVQIFVQF